MSLYDETIPTFTRMLTNLEAWLVEAKEMATAREFDPEQLLTSRLFVDQFTLRRNIQSTCDTAKLAGARLLEVEAPVHEDGESTLPELEARIADVKRFLSGLDRAAVDAASGRVMTPSFLQGMSIVTDDYVREFAIPNFFFHLTTSYAILRSCGVKLGKRAYLGTLSLKKAE
ncbi:MAG: DUF1993 domain-containing protein [Myxococcales bacterium]|nr:DUF1993 domain-containing protein [Myxococcales bacterium]